MTRAAFRGCCSWPKAGFVGGLTPVMAATIPATRVPSPL